MIRKMTINDYDAVLKYDHCAKDNKFVVIQI